MTPTERADEIDRAKRCVEDGIEDYRQALLAYAVWMHNWRACQRSKETAQ